MKEYTELRMSHTHALRNVRTIKTAWNIQQIIKWFYLRNFRTQLVEALCYKQEGRGFDSRWCHWNFLLT
jgi:hypothetical protein